MEVGVVEAPEFLALIAEVRAFYLQQMEPIVWMATRKFVALELMVRIHLDSHNKVMWRSW